MNYLRLADLLRDVILLEALLKPGLAILIGTSDPVTQVDKNEMANVVIADDIVCNIH